MAASEDSFPDGPFPDGYGPVGESGAAVEEAGLLLYALQPMRDGIPRVFILRAYKDGKMVGERKLLLEHENRFGLDVADIRTLEAATDELVAELGNGETAGGG